MVADNNRGLDMVNVIIYQPVMPGNNDMGKPEKTPIKSAVQALKGTFPVPGKQPGRHIKNQEENNKTNRKIDPE